MKTNFTRFSNHIWKLSVLYCFIQCSILTKIYSEIHIVYFLRVEVERVCCMYGHQEMVVVLVTTVTVMDILVVSTPYQSAVPLKLNIPLGTLRNVPLQWLQLTQVVPMTTKELWVICLFYCNCLRLRASATIESNQGLDNLYVLLPLHARCIQE